MTLLWLLNIIGKVVFRIISKNRIIDDSVLDAKYVFVGIVFVVFCILVIYIIFYTS